MSGKTDARTPEEEVERELLRDRLIYGNSFHKIVSGKKVRVDPRDVYIRPCWWVRLWYWISWNFWRRWI